MDGFLSDFIDWIWWRFNPVVSVLIGTDGWRLNQGRNKSGTVGAATVDCVSHNGTTRVETKWSPHQLRWSVVS